MSLDSVFCRSQEIVARQIEGEIVIIPLTSKVAAGEDHLFTLNETGRAIWNLLDGKTNVKRIVALLEKKFDHKNGQIERDVLGLVKELLARKILVLPQSKE